MAFGEARIGCVRIVAQQTNGREMRSIDQLRGGIVRHGPNVSATCCLGSAMRIMVESKATHLRRKLVPVAVRMCAHRRINEQINQSLQYHCQGCVQPSRRLNSPSMGLLDATGAKHGAIRGTTVGIPIGNFPAFSYSALQSANSLH